MKTEDEIKEEIKWLEQMEKEAINQTTKDLFNAQKIALEWVLEKK